MPDKDEDIGFTFDTTPFTNGIKKIASGIFGLTKNTANMAKNVSKGVVNAAAKIGLLSLAFKGVQAVIREMPEVSQTFKIAKDVMFKNLLFPLRKAIFPILQKFLDWVRDNRAMFVKWGQSLANIFTFVVSLVQKVIDIGKKLGSVFMDFINRVFGTQIRTFQDLLNIFSFKIAVIIEFIKKLIEPIGKKLGPVINNLVEKFKELFSPISKIAGHIFDIGKEIFSINENGNSLLTIFEDIVGFIGDAAKWAAEMAESFVKGFKPYVAPVVDSIAKIAKSFKSIFESIFGSDERIKGWKEIFEFIGTIIGTTVKATFEVIESIVKTIDSTLKSIDDLSKVLTGEKPSEDFAKNLSDALIGIFDFFNPAQAAIRKAQEKKVDDAIIKPTGEVIRTSPEDYIIATKTPAMAAGGGKSITLNFPGMQIYLQNATREEAERAGSMIVDKIRAIFYEEMESMGGV